MRLPDPARALAVTAAAAGATLLGASLGGMASVDGQLRAVAPAPLRVVEGTPVVDRTSQRCPWTTRRHHVDVDLTDRAL